MDDTNGAGLQDGSPGHYERSRNLNDQMGGQLHPDWVSCLMGYPAWWLDDNGPPEGEGLLAFYTLIGRTDQGPLLDRVACMVAGHPWPAGRGAPQHDWEPPRTVKGMKGRANRIKMLGNAVVPQWAVLPLAVIVEVEIFL